MAKLRIFESDPEAAEREAKRLEMSKRYVPDFLLKSGMLDEHGNPASLPTWRVLAYDPKAARGFSELTGQGEFTEAPDVASKEHNLALITDRDEIQILLDGPDSVDARFQLWSSKGKLLHECDGMYFLSENRETDVVGGPCGCPPTIKGKKAAAKDGDGPDPKVRIDFRLPDDPELGTFRYTTGSWGMAEAVYIPQNELDRIGEAAIGYLSLTLVEFTTKSGVNVSYFKPGLRVTGSYNAAIAEDR